jgi:Spy/CpxP family protein refolding chaperone
MKTIKTLLLVCMLAISSLPLAAQEPGKAGPPPDGPKNGSRREKVEALRVAYITRELDLTEAEAQTFWPVYNEYHKKVEALRKDFKSKYNKQTNYNFATDKEAEDYINADIQLKMQEAELIKTYYDKIKKVLPVKKVAKLRHAEESFRQELLKQIKNKMGE